MGAPRVRPAYTQLPLLALLGFVFSSRAPRSPPEGAVSSLPEEAKTGKSRLGRFLAALYREQWVGLLERAGERKAFMEENKGS